MSIRGTCLNRPNFPMGAENIPLVGRKTLCLNLRLNIFIICDIALSYLTKTHQKRRLTNVKRPISLVFSTIFERRGWDSNPCALCEKPHIYQQNRARFTPCLNCCLNSHQVSKIIPFGIHSLSAFYTVVR